MPLTSRNGEPVSTTARKRRPPMKYSVQKAAPFDTSGKTIFCALGLAPDGTRGKTNLCALGFKRIIEERALADTGRGPARSAAAPSACRAVRREAEVRSFQPLQPSPSASLIDRVLRLLQGLWFQAALL
mmetsp:Transcript_88667/g.169981  ORF Transcript_88667/g.169981 Transcript_88667/m.169981 type:complete len:129 (-) Transcript_88667:278-664(-)